mmetsp:Transcript_48304/g.70596  ORF Transcript_48304/g.70596 Transcript_48304/m.70596 type:complete len:217 (-) Transcript_48304:23-673(-)
MLVTLRVGNSRSPLSIEAAPRFARAPAPPRIDGGTYFPGPPEATIFAREDPPPGSSSSAGGLSASSTVSSPICLSSCLRRCFSQNLAIASLAPTCGFAFSDSSGLSIRMSSLVAIVTFDSSASSAAGAPNFAHFFRSNTCLFVRVISVTIFTLVVTFTFSPRAFFLYSVMYLKPFSSMGVSSRTGNSSSEKSSSSPHLVRFAIVQAAGNLDLGTGQ